MPTIDFTLSERMYLFADLVSTTLDSKDILTEQEQHILDLADEIVCEYEMGLEYSPELLS